jgi:hypothetical protein
MKAGACILTLIWAVLLVEPVFANFTTNTAKSSCSKNKVAQSSCSMSKCKKSRPSKDKNDCEKNRCNPLMACPTGNFYLSGHSHLSISPLLISRQKTILVNDNRILKRLSECWHPPEII